MKPSANHADDTRSGIGAGTPNSAAFSGNNVSSPHRGKGPRLMWRLFFYLAVFTAVILVILWLFQVVFLDSIYKLIKISDIRVCAERLTDLIASDNIEELESRSLELAHSRELCVLILRMTDKDTAIEVVSVDTQLGCVIHNTDKASKFTLYDSAVANGGSLTQRFRFDSRTRSYYSTSDGIMAETTDDRESIVYTLLAKDGAGQDYLVMLNSVITPVSATVRTLNTQLIIISGLLLALSLLMALIISRTISRPLERLNASARLLAGGAFDTRFSADGCREINELADTLNYAAVELGRVDDLRRELIANISHDLRTPLTMIEGYGEVMRDLPGENTPDNVQIIIDEAKRLTSLVNDILDISKLQSGNQELVLSQVNITAALSDMLGRYSRLISEGYTIRFDYDREVTLETDESRFIAVVYNLVNNAVTYTGADKLVAVTQTVSDNAVRISVTDTGEGIPPDKLENIWDRYYKVDKVHRRASVGTGLGLSIVKSTMDMLGGTYGVITSPGSGSTFWIELPYWG